MVTFQPAFSIRMNIVADAYGTSLFNAGLGFYVTQALHSSAVAGLMSASVGGLIGIVAGYPLAALSDRWGVRRVLSALQVVQALVLLPLVLTSNQALGLAAIAATFGLGRAVSPVRGALPPAYINRSGLLPFKAGVRTATLIAVLTGTMSAAAIAATGSERILVLVPIANIASFLAALAFTRILDPLPVPKATRPWWGSLGPVHLGRRGAFYLCAFFVVYMTSGVADATMPFAVAQRGSGLGWLIGAASAIGVLVALAGQVAVKRLSSLTAEQMGSARAVLGCGFMLLVVGVSLSALAVNTAGSTAWFIGLIILATVVSEVGVVVTSLVLWDVQYRIGPDDRRGAVVGMFSLSTSLGMAVSPALASRFFTHV